MAKEKNKPSDDTPPATDTSSAPAAPSAESPPAVATPPVAPVATLPTAGETINAGDPLYHDGKAAVTGKPNWRVHLNAPTPLMANPLEVFAADEAEARAKFCETNGIRGSDHPWTITAL